MATSGPYRDIFLDRAIRRVGRQPSSAFNAGAVAGVGLDRLASTTKAFQRRGQRFIVGKVNLAYKRAGNFRARNVPIEKAFYAAGLESFGRENVNGLIYLIGLIVVILFILSLLGLR